MLSFIVIFKEHTPEVERCLAGIETAARTVFNKYCHTYEILTSTRNNKSIARNLLCWEAKGDILVFIDADAYPTDFWLHELLKPFTDSNVGVVGGPNICPPDATEDEVLADKILTFPLATWKSAARYKVTGRIRETDEAELTSCNMAVRREAFMQAEGFPANIIPCEENVLMERIQQNGWKLIYNPMAIVYHSRDALFMDHLKKIHYYAKGRGMMIRKRQGKLKIFPKFSTDFIYLSIGLLFHYIFYISGLIQGFIQRDSNAAVK